MTHVVFLSRVLPHKSLKEVAPTPGDADEVKGVAREGANRQARRAAGPAHSSQPYANVRIPAPATLLKTLEVVATMVEPAARPPEARPRIAEDRIGQDLLGRLAHLANQGQRLSLGHLGHLHLRLCQPPSQAWSSCVRRRRWPCLVGGTKQAFRRSGSPGPTTTCFPWELLRHQGRRDKPRAPDSWCTARPIGPSSEETPHGAGAT